jgi:hypothetical protein
MAPLSELRDRVDAFLTAYTRLARSHHLGAPLPLGPLFQEHAELADPETFRRIDEAVRSGRTPERFLPGLRRLRAFLFDALAMSTAAEPLEQRAALEATGQVQLAHEALPLRDALAQLATSENPDRRALVEQAAARFLHEHAGPYGRAIEAELETARRLGADETFRPALEGLDLAALATAAEALLRDTDDAYRDLLGYGLKKLDPALRPGRARWHDLLHLATTPWLRGDFGLSDVIRASDDWLRKLGFHPNGGQRIQRDLASESNRAIAPSAFVVRAPQEVAVVLRPLGGLQDCLGYLHATGWAQQAANVEADAPVEDRRLGDTSVPHAFGLLFANLLLDEGFLKHQLGLAKPAAREEARTAALLQLTALRHACALFGFDAELRKRGPSSGVKDGYADRMAAALGVSVPAAFALHDRATSLEPARSLRAFALEARLTRGLQERFDQDFFRNPGAGVDLVERFGRGQREDADAIGLSLSGQPLHLAEAGARLVRVMAA